MRQELAAGSPPAGPVIIDEIQKLPSLLDEVQNLIESRGLRFVLSGSSPAKLRRGEQIVFERVASDAGVPARTVREYFQILEDTLVGVLLQPFSPPSARRKPVSHAKLYFFDVGAANVLAGRTRIEDRSADGSEVDFVVGDEVAIEGKGSSRIVQRDLIGMKRLADGVQVLPVRDFLGDLWMGGVL